METPLNAREFLKRFHLPQLVRIVSAAPVATPETGEEPIVGQQRICQPNDEQHERSDDWTYRPAGDDVEADEEAEFRSLAVCDNNLSKRDESKFHSISNVCSQQKPTMVIRTKTSHVEFCGHKKEEDDNRQAKSSKSQFRGESIRLMPPSKRPAQSKLELRQPFLLYKAYKKLELCAYSIDPNNQLNEKSGDPIYFPQNYPGWFSLVGSLHPLESIDQVCMAANYSQIFLTRDELIAYQLPAKLSHLTKLKNNQLLALPLAISLASASDSSGGKTKSKSKSRSRSKSSQRGKENNNKQSAGRSSSISDLKQVIIQSGQVLKICGIYEDVMPLIEGNQQLKSNFHNRNKHPYGGGKMPVPLAPQFHHPNQQQQLQQQQVMLADCSLASHQMAFQVPQQVYGRGGATSQSIQANSNGYNNNKQHNSSEQGPIRQQQQVLGMSRAANVREAQQRTADAAIYGQQSDRGALHLSLRPAGQRYARCMVLSQSSVDRMVTNSRLVEPNLTAASIVGNESDLEVLIPVEQLGRFYLCASSGSNLLQAASSLKFRSRLVFRLSQVISLLSLSRKLTSSCQAADCRRPLASTDNFALPLIVELVIGPRPGNFSPSMFGSSSSMESYFSQERNIGGHSIACHLHRSNQQASGQQVNNSGSSSSRQTEAACACALGLSNWMTTSGDTSTMVGLMSGLMRIERIAKRDVLLACTIKLDPLEYLEAVPTSEQLADNNKPLKVGNRRNHHLSVAERSSNCVSGRLMALREPPPNNKNHQQQQAELSSKLFGKSSFSRLRACRSLISLHGRRKKRPDIPVELLATSSRQPIPFLAAEQPLQATGGESNSHLMSQQQQQLCKAGELIVMVEFDCSDAELRFVRTFVDSSLPTSCIPDLVLNRIEHCNKNSSDWERQLKLSHRTLSHDFDCYKQQLLEQRWQQWRRRPLQSRQTSSTSFMYRDHGERDSIEQQRHQQQQQQRGLLLRPGDDPFEQMKPTRHKQQPANGSTPDAPAAGGDSGATCLGAVSTASSRSSSGVSSSGDRKRVLPASIGHRKSNSLIILNHDRAGHHLTNSTGLASTASSSSTTGDHASLTSSSAASCAASAATSCSTASLAAASSSTGRLLRLVNKILPGRTTSMAAGDKQQEQHPRLIDGDGDGDGDGRKISELDDWKKLANGRQMLVEQNHSQHTSTLMNSQKIHRRLLFAGGGVGGRQLASDAVTNGDTNKYHEQEQEQEEASDHLYESLEKISEQMQQQQRTNTNDDERLFNGRHHRPTIDGATMDIHARRPPPESEPDGEEDDDDDWWANGSSSHSTTITTTNGRWARAAHEPAAPPFRGRIRVRAGLRDEQPGAMEPVSIEAVEEVLVGTDSESSELSINGPAPNYHRSNPVLVEANSRKKDKECHQREIGGGGVYVNLQPSKSSFELDSRKHRAAAMARPKLDHHHHQQPISRMERKLLKIRSRRTSQCWPSEFCQVAAQEQQRPSDHDRTHFGFGSRAYDEDENETSMDDAEHSGELQLHSMINLPMADAASGDTRRHRMQYRAYPLDSSRDPSKLATGFMSTERSQRQAARSLSNVENDHDDNHNDSESVNSLLSLSGGRLEGAARDGATGERASPEGQAAGAAVDGAVNSLRSESESGASSSSSLASDDRAATEISSRYSSSSSSSSSLSCGLDGEGGGAGSSCKSSSADWSSLLGLANESQQQPLHKATRVGQVTANAPVSRRRRRLQQPTKATLAAVTSERPTCRARQ